MLEKSVLGTIALCRSLFYNTPLGKSKLATNLYLGMFKLAYRDQDKKITYQGVDLWVPTKDITIVPGLINGYYEKLEVEVFRGLVENSQVLLDVGGNIGLYSLIAAKYGPKDLRAFSFEPVPENISYLRRNIELNPGAENKVVVVEKAVGGHEGSLTLNLSPITVGTHTACELNVPGVTQIEVPVVTLDKFVSKEKLDVDLLKIDVEGYEGFVLQGAKDLIVKQKPTIFMEYLPDLMSRSDFDINDLRSLLFDHYKYCFVVDEMAQAITEIDVKGLDLTSFSGNIILTHKQKHTDFVRSQISAKG